MAKTVEISDLDRSFMSEAIRLASESAASGGGPFGAVIVRDSRIVASGSNSVTRDTDPTAHAEVNAIPLTPLMRDESLVSFRIWSANEDKKEY